MNYVSLKNKLKSAWALQLTKTKYLIRRSVAPPPSTSDADPPTLKVPHPSEVDRGLLAHIKRCIQTPSFCSSNTAFAILESKKKTEKGNIFPVFPTQKQIISDLKLKHILALLVG